MPVYTLQGPDGKTYDIEGPEGATAEQLGQFVMAQNSQQQSAPLNLGDIKGTSTDPIQPAPQEQPRGDASFGSRFGMGVMDPVHGGAQALTHMLPDSVVNAVNSGVQAVNDAPIIGPVTKFLGMTPASSQELDKRIQQREQEYQAARKEAGQDGIDWARMGGNIVGTTPVMLGVPAGTGLLSRALSGAIVGSGTTGLMPVTDGDYASEKTRQMTLAAGLGAAAGGAGSALASTLSPKVRPEVQALMDQGITPTPGQILGGAAQRTEEKLTSLPVLGDMIVGAQKRGVEDFNRAAYARALESLNVKAPQQVGREGVEGVKDSISAAYNNLLPKLQFKADQQFSSELGNLSNMVANAQTNPNVAKQFNNVLQNDVLSRMSKNGSMDGQSFKDMESALTQSIKKYGGSSNPADKDIGDALGEVLKSAREALSRSNPNYSDELSNINRAYANYARIRDAASRVGAEEGVFTPAQLQSAVRQADKSAGKGQFATGNALMQDLSEAGKAVLGSKYPDSGTAGRGILGMAATGGLAAIDPKLAAAALAATLPYTQTGGKIAAAALTKRPESFKALAEGLRRMTPAISAGAPLLVTGNNK